MKLMYNMKTQAGVALVLSLLLLLTMTLIGVAAMSATSVQERMSGNQKRITDGQMASEVGTLQFFDWLSENLDDEWGSYHCMDNPTDARCDGMPSVHREGEAINGQYYWVESLCWEQVTTDSDGNEVVNCVQGGVPDTQRGILTMMGHARQGAAELSEARLESRFEQRDFELCSLSDKGKELFPNPDHSFLEIFPGCGIVSQDEIRFSGGLTGRNATIYSDKSLDTSVFIQGQMQLTDSGLQAASEIDLPNDWNPDTDCNNCSVKESSPWDLHDSFWDDLDPANFSSEFFADALASSPDGDLCPLRSPQNRLELDGDQGGRTYYCTGDVTLKGDFHNAVVFVEGNLLHQAEVSGVPPGDPGEHMSLIVATGDIEFKGQSGDFADPDSPPFEGIFWAGGQFLQSGDSKIFGSVVARRGAELGAEFSGELIFDGFENQGLLDVEIRLAIHGWRQIWL